MDLRKDLGLAWHSYAAQVHRTAKFVIKASTYESSWA
jgi:hypothetical protein